MSQNNGPRVLAIALDAAEPTLIRRMIEQDEMPALKSLLAEGRWLSVKSPVHVGSGSVWPTFMTGCDPSVHGIYGEWCWQPDTMSVSRYQGGGLVPFWKRFVDEGATVGVLDLPFMPMLGLRNGFEISEWGPHDLLKSHMEVGPEGIRNLVSQSPAHALSSDRLDSEGPDDLESLTKLASSCLEGIKIRGALAQRLIQETQPQFALITFTEIHHAAHYLWHTEEPEHEAYAKPAFRNLRPVHPTLREIYHEVDRQIGELVATMGKAAAIMVFSLHGMQPAHGIPSFLAAVLCERGLAKLTNWKSQSWSERVKTSLAAGKRHTPHVLKKLYYKTAPITLTQQLARPTQLPPYDWSSTRAFSLPSDQHGWIRINLMGREARGIVPLEQYEETCSEAEKLLLGLTTAAGAPLVRDVVRTVKLTENVLAQRLPDLVVHWEDAVFAWPFQVHGTSVEATSVGRKFSGQHSPEGFCVFKGRQDLFETDSVAAKDLHTHILKLLETTVD